MFRLVAITSGCSSVNRRPRVSSSARSVAKRESIAGTAIGGRRRRLGQVYGGFARQLALVRIARLFGSAQLALRVVDVVRELGQAPEVIRPASAGHAEILEPEILEAVLGGPQGFVVLLDLVVDEAHRRPGILPLVAEARLDEDREQRLHDLARLVRVGVPVGDRVDVGRSSRRA